MKGEQTLRLNKHFFKKPEALFPVKSWGRSDGKVSLQEHTTVIMARRK